MAIASHTRRGFAHATTRRAALLGLTLLVLACTPDPDESELGELTLGLTTEASGVAYRLADARFRLEGPETRELAASDADELSVSLPSGAYRLTLQEGHRLVQSGDAGAPSVAARLVSQNPVPVLIQAGETARVTFRFELSAPSSAAGGSGVLAVGIAVGGADGGTMASAGHEACALDLRINELDTEQAKTDELEFVELLHAGVCAAPLADLAIELVNGSDGRVYGRYPLGEAAEVLAPGGRLVLGDPAVLMQLPRSVAQLSLKGSGLQNGPDGVRLVRGAQVLDAVAYGGPVPGSSEGAPSVADDATSALGRCPDGFDTQDGAKDLRRAAATPGAPNACAE